MKWASDTEFVACRHPREKGSSHRVKGYVQVKPAFDPIHFAFFVPKALKGTSYETSASSSYTRGA